MLIFFHEIQISNPKGYRWVLFTYKLGESKLQESKQE